MSKEVSNRVNVNGMISFMLSHGVSSVEEAMLLMYLVDKEYFIQMGDFLTHLSYKVTNAGILPHNVSDVIVDYYEDNGYGDIPLFIEKHILYVLKNKSKIRFKIKDRVWLFSLRINGNNSFLSKDMMVKYLR